MSNNDKPFSVRQGFAPQTLHMSSMEVTNRVWCAIYDLIHFDDALKALSVVFVASASGIADLHADAQPPPSGTGVGATDPFFAGWARKQDHMAAVRSEEDAKKRARNWLERCWEHSSKHGKWFKFYDLCEFLIAESSNGGEIAAAIQCALDKMSNAGCQLVDGKFIPDLSREEAEEVRMARAVPFAQARGHMQKAVSLFSEREKPDYANSIKESISAVESLVKEFTGKKMGPGLEKLRRDGFFPHSAFAEALKKHYGFASDAGGIRHAADGKSPEPDADTARFMLVTCAAFVNYMTARNSDKSAPVGD